MGRLLNPAVWQLVLSEHPAEYAELQRWVGDVDDDLEIVKWFDDGRSNHPVALVLRMGRTTPQQLVMKFCDRGVRTRALDKAWNASPGYRDNHLAKKAQDPIPLGKWQAVFFHIAGDDIESYRPLSEHRGDPSLPGCLRVIVTSVLYDWNERWDSRPESPTTGDLLLPLVNNRLADAEDWARNRGLAVDATSPFAFVSGADADRTVTGPLLGMAHGDLSARNIFVPQRKKLSADSYVLIDYDHFGADRLLAFDPMHLVVALALDDFDEYGAKIRADWIRLMIDLDETVIHPGAGPMRKICRAVRDGAVAAFPGKGLADLWRQQFLLGLVGAGLLHVGRELRTTSPDEARQWCYDLAAAAAQALRRKLGPIPEHKEDASSIRSTRRKRPRRRMINRVGEQAALRQRLTTGPFGAVVLHGLAGIGKSQVLDVVLDGIRGSDPTHAARVYQQVVDAATRLDLKTFIDALEGRSTSSTGPGQASLARLATVLQGLGDRPVTIALDGAEHLLKRGSDKLADLDLDEALELLTTDPDHRVSVVLAFRDIPVSPTGGGWPLVTGPIAIPRLEVQEFFDVLDDIDQDGILRVDRLDPAFRRKLHGRLQGNPRNAEIVVALVTFADRSLSLAELADRLFRWPPAEVSTKLVRLLAERLGCLRGSVVETLAAFGTPISAQAVASALDGEHGAGDVEQALIVLAGKRVVYQNENDDYYLPEPSASVILGRLTDERRVALMEAVARVLADIPDGPVTAVHDLRIRFAQLEALLNAGRCTGAYGVIEQIYRYLYYWNCGHLLTDQRLRVRFQLDDEHLEMANENGLADIYVSAGDFPAANEAFGRALEKANDLGDAVNRQKIRLNMANWYLDIGETNRARCYYELVRDEDGNLAVHMGALEGLADCDRRQGRYVDAIEHAEKALVLGKTDFSGDPTAADYAATGTVYTLMKLSRWHAEQGNHRKATTVMQEADAAAGGKSADWLLAARLDGWADLFLAQGDVPGSISAAEEAVDLAQAKRDEVVLLQAYTTLCVAHLHDGNTELARRQIQRAHLLRKRDRRGRSLLIVALRALITVRTGDQNDAAGLFCRLASESKHRTTDPQDFAARDMLGVAICGLAVIGDADVTDAEALFRETRRQVPGTPGLVSRLRFMVETLDAYGGKPGLLGPALDALRAG